MKYDVKEYKYSDNNVIYLSVGTNNNNPLEIEKDLMDIKQFLIDKYFDKKTKFSFINWIKSKL